MSVPLWAANDGENDASGRGAFRLGVVEVTGTSLRSSATSTFIDGVEMELLNLNTVGQALATQSGVSLSHNARNEDIVSLRGFDSRQVPVFLDGIPLYVPYDGYVDFGRFTTFDLARIDVSKGGASLLYGPNTLGGAVNLVSRKPEGEFEADMRLGSGSGERRMASLNAGSNQGSWYVQGGVSWLERQSFPLGEGFVDRKAVPTDTGSYRENAWSSDWKASLKLGFTPNATDEYAFGYTRQNGEKGNPVYTGESTQGIRFWQWPFWDKDSLYFIGSTALGAENTVKTRIYRDTYDNRINAYADAGYTVPGQRNFFPSVYHDRNTGASAEWINTSLERHELHVALHYKEDRHEEVGPTPPVARYRDVSRSIALEDMFSFSDSSRLRAGVSYEERDAREVYFWPVGSAHALNGLLELSTALDPVYEVFAGVSHKTRFPTIKDRYSARLGRALPNPDLAPEVALHTETGIRGTPWHGAHGSATIFYSRIDDLIQTGIVSSDQCGGVTCDQARNIGRARHRGVELEFDQAVADSWHLSAAYTFLDMDNMEQPSAPLTGAPRQRLYAYASWRPVFAWEAMLTVEAESGRTVPFAGSGQSSFRDLAGFGLWGVKGIWRPGQSSRVEAGIDNLADRSYELADGIPMPGRNWYLNLALEF